MKKDLILWNCKELSLLDYMEQPEFFANEGTFADNVKITCYVEWYEVKSEISDNKIRKPLWFAWTDEEIVRLCFFGVNDYQIVNPIIRIFTCSLSRTVL